MTGWFALFLIVAVAIATAAIFAAGGLHPVLTGQLA